MRGRLSALAILASCGAWTSAPAEPSRLEALNGDSCLRVHMGWKTPVIIGADGRLSSPAESKEARPVRQVETGPPPAGWMRPEHDDRLWAREHAPLRIAPWHGGGLMTAEFHLIAARGKFLVEDPAKCSGLKLAVKYTGGLVAYLNGKEVARASLPAGEIKPDTLAERYHDDCYLDGGGGVGSSLFPFLMGLVAKLLLRNAHPRSCPRLRSGQACSGGRAAVPAPRADKAVTASPHSKVVRSLRRGRDMECGIADAALRPSGAAEQEGLSVPRPALNDTLIRLTPRASPATIQPVGQDSAEPCPEGGSPR